MLPEGTRIRVIGSVYSREFYPWLPDLVGKTGRIAEAQDCGDGCVYTVYMDERFYYGEVPEGEHAFGYKPQVKCFGWKWSFTDEEIEAI